MTKRIPEILNKDEQEKLLNQFNLRYITPHRNKTMIKLILKTGLKLSEIINLKWRDINFMLAQINIAKDEGSRSRTIYINEDILEDLSSWKKRQFEGWGVSEYVFTSRNLKLLDGKAVRKMIRIYKDKADIDKKVTPQALRDTFALELLRESENIQRVQRALGHDDISNTQIYANKLLNICEKSHNIVRS